MIKEVSLTIAKILNWNEGEENTRVEVGFYGINSGCYLAHKTAVGYYSSQSLILNTSFKINFSQAEHIVNPSSHRSFAKYHYLRTKAILRWSAPLK